MIEAFAETLAELKREVAPPSSSLRNVLSEVERTCDRVAVIRDGRLAAVETIAGIREALPRRVTVRLARADAGRLPPSRVSAWYRKTRRVGSRGVRPAGAAAAAIARPAVDDFDVQPASLEDYVLHLYSDRR